MFKGYQKEAIVFLKNLRNNNNKQWFEAHREGYEEFLLLPTRDLVTALGDFMLTIDPNFEIRPVINKTISKIYRDTRFSKNKTLLKTSIWITFKRPTSDWKEAPAFYFEVMPDGYRFGMGFYGATPATMKVFRALIDEYPSEFKEAISFFSKQKTFSLVGEKYKKIFDESKPKAIQDWYQCKNFYLVCDRRADDILFSEKLVKDLMKNFKLLTKLYRFLLEVKLEQLKKNN